MNDATWENACKVASEERDAANEANVALKARIVGLEAMIPKLPCCPDGFMDEPCTSLCEARTRVAELERELLKLPGLNAEESIIVREHRARLLAEDGDERARRIREASSGS